MAKPALGRGLGALMGAPPVSPSTTTAIKGPSPVSPAGNSTEDRVQRVPLDRIRPSPLQPRKEFSPEALQELAESIRAQGIVQPLIVREREDHFELIAGERRWRAAQLLKLAEVPVISRQADDRSVLELALIENLQRENLNPLEEALGYAQLAGQFGLTQEQIALKVGKSRAAVANATRLLKLPATIQEHLRKGQLSVGHAKVILGLNEESRQLQAAIRIVENGLNVRQAESLIEGMTQPKPPIQEDGSPSKTTPTRDANLSRIEDKLREKFGTQVHLKYSQGKGCLEVRFFNDNDLQRVLEILDITAD